MSDESQIFTVVILWLLQGSSNHMHPNKKTVALSLYILIDQTNSGRDANYEPPIGGYMYMYLDITENRDIELSTNHGFAKVSRCLP